MKKIALMGASGKTGRSFLKLALAAGYEVRALVRTPQNFEIQHPKLTVIAGDVLNLPNVLQCLESCSMVVSLFGQVKNSPRDLQTRGTANILAAMQQTSISQIISLSGGGLPFAADRPKLPDHLIRFIMKLVVPHVLKDAAGHAELLARSTYAWMIVRAPRLTLEPARGHYRVGWVGVNASTSIGRDDLAHFILQQCEQPSFWRQMPFVSY